MKTTLKPLRVLIPILALFFLGGCSSQPSVSDARAILEKKIKAQSGGRINLASFKKTNSQEGEMMGVKLYGLEYEAEIEFTEDCYWRKPNAVERHLGSEVSFETRPNTGESRGFNWLAFQGLVEVQKGQREKITGTFRFEKTEKGWRGQDGQIISSNFGLGSLLFWKHSGESSQREEKPDNIEPEKTSEPLAGSEGVVVAEFMGISSGDYEYLTAKVNRDTVSFVLQANVKEGTLAPGDKIKIHWKRTKEYIPEALQEMERVLATRVEKVQ